MDNGSAHDLQGFHCVHADEQMLVLVKPAGLPSVPGRAPGLDDCLASRVQAVFADALVVHRLDMSTSGLMVMARGLAAQQELSAAFAERRVDKRYTAVVSGLLSAPPGEWREIDLPLAADWPNRPRQQVDRLRGKPSSTRYRVLALDAARNRTRVELHPLTGRTHQLRVHMLALGHPIEGDALYAEAAALPAAAAPAARLLLHAHRLGLAHPLHGRWLSYFSDPPF